MKENKENKKDKEDKEDNKLGNLLKIKIEDNNIFHNACMTGNKEIINKILDEHPDIYRISNYRGDNCLLLLIRSGFYDIAKKLIEKNKDILNLLDNMGNTIFQNTNNYDFLDYLIEVMSFDILNNLNLDENETPLLYLLKLSANDNKYLDLIDKLLNKKKNENEFINVNEPKYNLPLCYSIRHNNEDIFNKLINLKNIEVNIFDKFDKTPLIYAIEMNNEKFIIKLIEKEADINMNNNFRDSLPINIIIKNKNPKLFELFLKFNPKLDLLDSKMNTPLHYLLYSNKPNKWVNEETLNKILLKENLDIKNLKGITVNDIIKGNKEIFNYEINNLNKKSKLKEKNYIDQSETTDEENNIKSNIKSNIKNNKDNKKDLILPNTIKTNFGLFNADTVHSFIYMYYLLKKYNNLFIPFQFSFDIKRENDIYELESYNHYKSNMGDVIYDYLINIYSRYFYELLPYIIFWHNKNVYYIHKNLDFYIRKIITDDKIEFIMIKLTLILGDTSSHANVILYDIKNNNVYRFDPYGEFNSNDVDELDNKLENLFKSINNKINYYSPKMYMYDYKFQLMSGDIFFINRNHGDPEGYCLAWVIFFVELIIKNKNKDIKDIIKTSFNKILEYNKNLLDFIRNYGFYLNKEKDKIMKQIDIKYEKIYNNNYKDEKLNKIFGFINKFLNKKYLNYSK